MIADKDSDDLLGDANLGREPFKRDSAVHYTGHCESRVLIDPAWIEFGNPHDSFTRLNQLVAYADKVTTPVKIELLFPKYLKPPKAHVWEGAFFSGGRFRQIDQPSSDRSAVYLDIFARPRERFKEMAVDYAKSPTAERTEVELDRLIYGGLLFGRSDGMDLLSLSLEHRCDYLLSTNPWLLDSADALKEAGIWVTDPERLLELLQLSLRSVGVFLEVVNPAVDEDWGELGRVKIATEGLGLSHFYHMENRALQTYQQWFGKVATVGHHPRLANHGRAAFYHRFPLMLYAHDQVRYHALYAQRFTLDNRYRGDHRFYVAYHVNAFYVMLSALLDNIAWIWNYALGCGLNEHDRSRLKCGLTHKEFKRLVRASRPDFVALLEDKGIATWLHDLTLKRDPAVHREPLFLTEVYEEGTGRLLSSSASVVAQADRVIIFDLLQAADDDLRMLHDFLGRMGKLPAPRPGPAS